MSIGPPVDGPKDPWPRVLSLPEWFVGDPVSLARDNIMIDKEDTSIRCIGVVKKSRRGIGIREI